MVIWNHNLGNKHLWYEIYNDHDISFQFTIFLLGGFPYPSIPNETLLKTLKSGNDEYIYIPQDVTKSSDQNNIQMETATSFNSDTGATLPAICGALSKRLSETML